MNNNKLRTKITKQELLDLIQSCGTDIDGFAKRCEVSRKGVMNWLRDGFMPTRRLQMGMKASLLVREKKEAKAAEKIAAKAAKLQATVEKALAAATPVTTAIAPVVEDGALATVSVDAITNELKRRGWQVQLQYGASAQ